MAWNGNYTIFYGYNHCPELNSQMETPPPLPTLNTSSCGGRSGINNSPLQERKKRLSTDQIESLERSFQEEIKLEPDRKMRLARELGLQPRQVAVWFQNRRARWKTKQLERVYGALKHEFDAVTKEKQKLQEEVMKLRDQLQKKSRVETKQGSTTCHTDATSAEETVESNAVVICSGCDNKLQGSSCHQTDDCNYFFHGDGDDYDSSLPTYWGVFPTYPWG